MATNARFRHSQKEKRLRSAECRFASNRGARVVWLVGKNGDTAETLRELISVSDRELTELHEWAACSSPAVAVGIENMLKFRSKVAREFDRLA